MRLKPATLYALWHTASAFALPVTPGRSRKGLSSRRRASTIGPEAPSNEKPGPKPPPLATIPPPTPSTPPSLSVPLICAVSALQSACFGSLATGRDAIVQAHTGSGKTIAFLLPIIEQLNPASKEPQALVISPSRELAFQTARVADLVRARVRVRVN